MKTHSGRGNDDGLRYFLSNESYIAAQPAGPYRDWLWRINELSQRLAGTRARIGYRNHSHLVRWFRIGWPARDVVDRLHGRPFRKAGQ